MTDGQGKILMNLTDKNLYGIVEYIQGRFKETDKEVIETKKELIEKAKKEHLFEDCEWIIRQWVKIYQMPNPVMLPINYVGADFKKDYMEYFTSVALKFVSLETKNHIK